MRGGEGTGFICVGYYWTSMEKRWERRTERLGIRWLTMNDLTPLYEMHADAEAMKFLGGVWTLKQTRETLERILERDARGDSRWMAVDELASGRFIGVCWLGPLGARWDAELGAGHIELGYRYDRRYWGRGYATEAGEAMLRRGFEEMELPEIVAIVNEENIASDRVLNKLGMKYHRTFRQEGLTIKFYKQTHDDFLGRCRKT
jgi:[ribosomal protein S5]-alanine N-acetyltransferase